ncbi:hypothetical protein [Paractinoplanes ferrugineus]|nr:hypothetical protein [Actinoplanes ferrugineus]
MNEIIKEIARTVRHAVSEPYRTSRLCLLIVIVTLCWAAIQHLT